MTVRRKQKLLIIYAFPHWTFACLVIQSEGLQSQVGKSRLRDGEPGPTVTTYPKEVRVGNENLARSWSTQVVRDLRNTHDIIRHSILI